MKSLFKRSLAAATGSVLALTQLALMANVNISAEEATTAANTSSSAVTVTAGENSVYDILYVPVSAELFKEAVLKDGKAEVGKSEIGNKIETALLSAGDKTFTSSLASVKAKLKTKMMQNGYIDSATADELLAAIKDATITVTTEGKITGTAKVDECGAAIGKAVENALLTRRNKTGIKADDGTLINIDWSKFKASGTINIEGQIDFDNNTVEYKVSATSGDGATINSVEAAEDYATKKLTEAAGVVAAAAQASTAAGHPATKLAKEIANYTGKGGNGDAAAKSFVDALKEVKLENYNKLDSLYADYMTEANNAIDKSGLSERNITRVKNQENKYTPETAMSVFDNEKVKTNYEKAVNKFNEKFGDTVQWAVSLDNVKTIIENAEGQKGEYLANYNVNGFNADAVLYIDDDAQQKALIDAASEAMNPKQFFEAGWTVVLNQEDGQVLTADDFKDDTDGTMYSIIQVVAKKKIEAATENSTNLEGKASLNVTRFVKQIVVQKNETTTTSTSETTDVTSSTTASTDVSAVSTDISTNVTSSTSETTTNGDQTGETTVTTAATFISFEVSGDDLVYWSEETDKVMDISNLSVTLRIVEGGILNENVKIDVTKAFDLEYNTTAGLQPLQDGIGYNAQSVPLVVKDVTVLEDALKQTKYDGLVAEQGIKNGFKDSSLNFFATFVLRGDSNLNGTIGLDDAMLALQYYTQTMLGQRPTKELLDDDAYVERFIGEHSAEKVRFFSFEHYAMDVADGNGKIGIDDAQNILKYYTYFVSGQHVSTAENPWEDAEFFNLGHIDPLNELHYDPYFYDPRAVELRKDALV